MNFNMSKCLESFSLALDFAEMDYLKVNMHHSRRVTYIALNIGRAMGLSEDDQKDLYALSLLHDNGLTLSGLKLRGREFELMSDHCIEGERNILSIPLLKPRENVIKYHHENYDGTGFYGISGEDIPLFSQIIHLSDSLDTKFNLTKLGFQRREDVKEHVMRKRKKFFSPIVADALLSFLHKERFWADLLFYNIVEVLNRVAPQIVYEYSWEDIFPISETFMKIIDSKSKFTYRHSRGITEKIGLMSTFYNFASEKKMKLHIAANLHDLGKLYIPNSILEKPDKLDSFEFSEIKKHTYFTKLALDKIPGFEDITGWAANHHEKLNGRGYPESLTAEDLDFESRLMGVVDIYQALTEDRPYREGSTHREAIKILYDMARGGFIDKQIPTDADNVIGASVK
ncbi:cyclic di-GMP phosphodiesterase response regulator RpfG [bacterium BMS3Bbin06]|nr:cyclic di-GMP phosphodiesterase response regulator RpfG [bacterium BMS3Bbin06]